MTAPARACSRCARVGRPTRRQPARSTRPFPSRSASNPPPRPACPARPAQTPTGPTRPTSTTSARLARASFPSPASPVLARPARRARPVPPPASLNTTAIRMPQPSSGARVCPESSPGECGAQAGGWLVSSPSGCERELAGGGQVPDGTARPASPVARPAEREAIHSSTSHHCLPHPAPSSLLPLSKRCPSCLAQEAQGTTTSACRRRLPRRTRPPPPSLTY